jgi:iron complex transport system permease protein
MPIISFIIGMCVGKYPLNPFQALSFLVNDKSLAHGVEYAVFFNVRLPRVIMAMLFGAVMGVSGATLQTLLRNPLVSPYTLGISSGAAFGAALSLILGFYGLSVEISALLFSLLALFLVFSLAKVRGKLSPISTILAGVIVSALFHGAVMLLQVIADPMRLAGVVGWIAGRLNEVSWSHVLMSAPLALAGLSGLMMLRWRIFVLSLGDEEARALGIDVTKERLIAILLSCLAVSAVVAAAGIIGWICLIAPHIARLIGAPNPRELLPVSASVGATFLLLTDSLARTVWTYEIPVGIIATIIGAPLFLYLLKRTTQVFDV